MPETFACKRFTVPLPLRSSLPLAVMVSTVTFSATAVFVFSAVLSIITLPMFWVMEMFAFSIISNTSALTSMVVWVVFALEMVIVFTLPVKSFSESLQGCLTSISLISVSPASETPMPFLSTMTLPPTVTLFNTIPLALPPSITRLPFISTFSSVTLPLTSFEETVKLPSMVLSAIFSAESITTSLTFSAGCSSTTEVSVPVITRSMVETASALVSTLFG